MFKTMPSYQPTNEQSTYITLQNVTYAPGAGYFDSICGMNAIAPDDNLCSELTMEDDPLCLEIIEQPVETYRYRYKSEKGSHGGIKGANTAHSKKSFPTVKVKNCPPSLRRKVIIKVSLYTIEPEPRLHVYELTGKNSVGVALDEHFMAVFKSLAIYTRKKEEVLEILKERKKADNGSAGIPYDEVSLEAEANEEWKSIILDSARLCFEAFSIDDLNTPLCSKIFSNRINNQKSAATGDLKIVRLSRITGKCSGGEEVFLFCDKVKKDDIKVRFSKMVKEECIWSSEVDVNPADIHHQVAMVFKTPQYNQVNEKEIVNIQLYRPSDHTVSKPLEFTYIPDEKSSAIPCANGNLLNTQTASIAENESFEIPRKRKRLRFDENTESSEYYSESTVMDSPHSIDDDLMDSIGLDLRLFDGGIDDLEPVENENFIMDDQLKDFLGSVFNQQNFPKQVFPQGFTPCVVPDGMIEVSNSMDSLSLFDKCYKQGQEKSKIQKAFNDFVIGMERILQNRDERTYLHYATHLIPLQDEDGNSFLHLAIMEQSSNLNLIWKMMEIVSEDVINHQNKFKKTPLHLAVKGNHVEILYLLLVKGGDPNLFDRDGNNCLHLAAKYGHIKCLKVLIPPSENRRTWKHEISNVDTLNYDGMSALHVAVTRNFEDCMNFLLNSKADVNLPEKKCGQTSLHLAVEHPSLLQAILKRPEVDINIKDFRSYNAVQLACIKTGKTYEVVSEQLKEEKDEIIKFLENLNQDGECSSCSEEVSDGESTDSSEFEDAVEDFGLTSCGIVCKAISTSELMCTNGKKSSMMKTEEELHMYLDGQDRWKRLADLIGLPIEHVALFNEGLSPGQAVIREIKDLYHPCQLKTIIEILELAGLEEGARILQKKS